MIINLHPKLRMSYQSFKLEPTRIREIISTRNMGLLLRLCSGQRPHIAMNGEPRGFKCCGGILELQREIQTSSCVGPVKTNLPFELRGRDGCCSRVTGGD